MKADGSLWTWGNNDYGQLGDGTVENRSVPVKVMDGVAQVSLWEERGAALKTDGSVWTWGRVEEMRLADNGFPLYHTPPVKVIDGGAAAVSVGGAHFAALKMDGSLWTWGRNDHGQLGDGTTENRSEPVRIMEDVVSVVLGDSCGAAIKTDGSLWTWGSGLLADGSGTERHSPVCVTKEGEDSGAVPPVPSADTGYDDVGPGAWYAPYVGYCSASGVMIGTGERRFEPERELTKMECLTMAMRLYGLRRGGDGMLLQAPEEWGKISLRLSDGTVYAGYGAATVSGQAEGSNGIWRFSSFRGMMGLGSLHQSLRTPVTEAEKDRINGLEDMSAAVTVDGVSYAGRVNCRWADSCWVLEFQPDGAAEEAAFAALSQAAAFSADPQNWFRNTLYTFCVTVPEEERLAFSGLSSWQDGNFPAYRLDFALAVEGSAGTLEEINAFSSVPDTEDARILSLYNAGILTGMDEYGTFAGERTLIRAEAAAMIARVLNPELRLRFVPKA